MSKEILLILFFNFEIILVLHLVFSVFIFTFTGLQNRVITKDSV